MKYVNIYVSKFFSYDKNTVVVLFLAERDRTPQYNWSCYSSNDQGEFLISTTTPRHHSNNHPECLLASFFITCNTVSSPNNFYIFHSEQKSGSMVNLNFEYPVKEDLGVVSCTNSIYFGERWQLYLMSIEHHYHIGIRKQVYYLMSAIQGLHELLREYQKEGVIDLRLWTIPNIPEIKSFENTLKRDKIGVVNDCLMRYREAADFIIFHDPDEFIMLSQGRDLYETIDRLYTNKVAFIRLNAYSTYVYSTKEISTFNYSKIMNTTRIMKSRTNGKYICRPDIVESVGVHGPHNYSKSRKMLNMKPRFGVIAHLRNWEFIDDNEEPLYVSSKS